MKIELNWIHHTSSFLLSRISTYTVYHTKLGFYKSTDVPLQVIYVVYKTAVYQTSEINKEIVLDRRLPFAVLVLRLLTVFLMALANTLSIKENLFTAITWKFTCKAFKVQAGSIRRLHDDSLATYLLPLIANIFIALTALWTSSIIIFLTNPKLILLSFKHSTPFILLIHKWVEIFYAPVFILLSSATTNPV